VPDNRAPRAISALDHIRPLEGAISLKEKTDFGALNLRGTGASFLEAAQHALGLQLPLEPNTTSRTKDIQALWLGPDEWLLRAPLGQTSSLAMKLNDALRGHHAALTDVSDQWAGLRLSGQDARTVLAKGCPLDFHPRVFRPGLCAQSHYLKAPLIIAQVDEVPTYDIQVRRSFAEYLWMALTQSAEEFALTGVDRQVDPNV